MIIFHKILPMFFMPITLMMIFVLFGTLAKKRQFVFIGLFIFYVSSTPIFSDWIYEIIEKRIKRVELHELPSVDAIVVLSGMLRAEKHGNAINIDWGDPDRFFGGLQAYGASKASRIVFTGGRSPWEKNLLSEGDVLKSIAPSFGVLESEIEVSDDAFNTEQEAMAVRKTLNGVSPSIILVTSALHMPRAIKIFENAGFVVHPFPVDFRVASKDFNLMHFLPRPEALLVTEVAIREQLGRVYYDAIYSLK